RTTPSLTFPYTTLFRSGLVNLRFYHFNAAQKNQFRTGALVRCYGEPRRGASGLELYHPEYNILDDGLDADLEPSLTPVYPATDRSEEHTSELQSRENLV